MHSKVRNNGVFLTIIDTKVRKPYIIWKEPFQNKDYIHNDNHCMHYQRALHTKSLNLFAVYQWLRLASQEEECDFVGTEVAESEDGGGDRGAEPWGAWASDPSEAGGVQARVQLVSVR